jgi:hypothetical protein
MRCIWLLVVFSFNALASTCNQIRRRREWRGLSPKEKSVYLKAVRRLKTTQVPGKLVSYYGTIVDLLMGR